MAIEEISCHQLKEKLEQGDDFTLIDVREPEEFEVANIDGSILIPLGEIEEHIPEFDPEASYVIHCRSGQRSAQAVDVMQENGFGNVVNLKGGIHRWAIEIEKKLDIL